MGSSCLHSLVPAFHSSKIDSSKNIIFLSSSSVATPKWIPFFEKSLKPQRFICSSTDDAPGSTLYGQSIPRLASPNSHIFIVILLWAFWDEVMISECSKYLMIVV